MTAFFGKIGQYIASYVMKLITSYILDFINAYRERRQAEKVRAEQEKKDKKNLETYKDKIKNGTEAEIDKETDNLLNN